MKRCLVWALSAVLLFALSACEKEKARRPEAAYGVLERVFGDSSHFELSYASSINTNLIDTFSYEAKEGKVFVKGENDLAIVRGCYEYLKDHAGVMVTWQQRHPVIENYPDAELTMGGTPHKFRHHFNVCTFGYTAPYWKWDRWEEELDWLALHGVNMPLAMVGFQAVARKVWRDQGVSEKGLREYFPGPAYLPWFIMGNLYKHNGPCPDKFIDETKILQDQILGRMRELGMTPVVPGFAGFVPEEYAEAHGKTNFHPMAHWCALPGECQSWWIAPGTETFAELTKAWMQTYTNMYGPVKYFLADSFNEMEIPVTSTLTEDLRRYGRESYAAIHSAIDDAVWVMQGWMFFFQKDTWTKEAVQSFLKDIPVGGIIVIDLASDNMQVWKEHEGFYGHEWLRCIAHTFGGFNDPHGELQLNYSKMFDQEGDPEKGRQVGVGLTPEALDNNEVVFELLSDSAWQEKEGKLGDWLAKYCKARYGAYNSAVSNAWDHFLKSFYKGKGDHYHFQGSPHLSAWGRNSFEDGWQDGVPNLLSCSNEFAKSSLYVDDCVEFTMRYGMVAADRIIMEAAYLYLFGKTNEMVAAADRLDKLAGLMEKMAATREHLLLSRWADRAREWGATEEEKKYYASDAKRLVTAWGGFLNGYATRAWSGIIYYHNSEWQHYLRRLAAGIKEEDIQWELRDIEKDFWNAGGDKEGYREVEPDWQGVCREVLEQAQKDYEYSVKAVDEMLLKDRGKQYGGFGFSDSKEPIKGTTLDMPKELQGKKSLTVIIKGPAHAVPMKVYFAQEGKKRLVFKPLEYQKDFAHGDEHRYQLKAKKPLGEGKVVLEFDRALVQGDHWAGINLK